MYKVTEEILSVYQVKIELNKLCQNCYEGTHCKQHSGLDLYEVPEGEPILGALEVYVDGVLLFSKLKGKSWPIKGLVKQRFEDYIN